jgi:hypothetical protein
MQYHGSMIIRLPSRPRLVKNRAGSTCASGKPGLRNGQPADRNEHAVCHMIRSLPHQAFLSKCTGAQSRLFGTAGHCLEGALSSQIRQPSVRSEV